MIRLAAVLASDNCLYDIMVGIEHHKGFFGLGIQLLTVFVTVGGGLFVVWKYYQDKRESRAKAELDLKREAYADYFATIPLQSQAILNFNSDDDAEGVNVPIEYRQAHHRLLLLASHDALQCLVERNSMFVEGISQLEENRRKAKHLAALAISEEDRLTKEMAVLRQEMLDRNRHLFLDLNANYRVLLTLARKEIEFTGNMARIVETLRRDAEEFLDE